MTAATGALAICFLGLVLVALVLDCAEHDRDEDEGAHRPEQEPHANRTRIAVHDSRNKNDGPEAGGKDDIDRRSDATEGAYRGARVNLAMRSVWSTSNGRDPHIGGDYPGLRGAGARHHRSRSCVDVGSHPHRHPRSGALVAELAGAQIANGEALDEYLRQTRIGLTTTLLLYGLLVVAGSVATWVWISARREVLVDAQLRKIEHLPITVMERDLFGAMKAGRAARVKVEKRRQKRVEKKEAKAERAPEQAALNASSVR